MDHLDTFDLIEVVRHPVIMQIAYTSHQNGIVFIFLQRLQCPFDALFALDGHTLGSMRLLSHYTG